MEQTSLAGNVSYMYILTTVHCAFPDAYYTDFTVITVCIILSSIATHCWNTEYKTSVLRLAYLVMYRLTSRPLIVYQRIVHSVMHVIFVFTILMQCHTRCRAM